MNPVLAEFYFYKTIPIFPSYKWNYDKYQKVYHEQSFDTDFTNSVFNIFKKPISNFYNEEKNGIFFDSNAMEINGDEISFHAEFDNILFFYLYNSIRSHLTEFYNALKKYFEAYENEKGYKIPLYYYNERFAYLKGIPNIFEVFKFLIETRTNTIERHDDDLVINIKRIKSFEKEFDNYKFS